MSAAGICTGKGCCSKEVILIPDPCGFAVGVGIIKVIGQTCCSEIGIAEGCAVSETDSGIDMIENCVSGRDRAGICEGNIQCIAAGLVDPGESIFADLAESGGVAAYLCDTDPPVLLTQEKAYSPILQSPEVSPLTFVTPILLKAQDLISAMFSLRTSSN